MLLQNCPGVADAWPLHWQGEVILHAWGDAMLLNLLLERVAIFNQLFDGREESTLGLGKPKA